MDRSFRVGNCLVEQDLDRVSSGSRTAGVRPQVMEVLVYLASRQNQVIHADDLLDDVWPGKVVTSASIYNCMSELRNAFQTCDPGQEYIQTVSRKGYRLVAPVAAPAESPQDSASLRQSVGQRIFAYIRIAFEPPFDALPDMVGRPERRQTPSERRDVFDFRRAHRHFLDPGNRNISRAL